MTYSKPKWRLISVLENDFHGIFVTEQLFTTLEHLEVQFLPER